VTRALHRTVREVGDDVRAQVQLAVGNAESLLPLVGADAGNGKGLFAHVCNPSVLQLLGTHHCIPSQHRNNNRNREKIYRNLQVWHIFFMVSTWGCHGERGTMAPFHL
jgi:hypothetical protein